MAAIAREDGILALGEICHLLRDGKDTILPLLVAIHLENIHTLVLETDADRMESRVCNAFKSILQINQYKMMRHQGFEVRTW